MTRGCFRCVSFSANFHTYWSLKAYLSVTWPIGYDPQLPVPAIVDLPMEPSEKHITLLLQAIGIGHIGHNGIKVLLDAACTANRSKKDCKLNKCPGEQVHVSKYWRNTASLCSSSTRLADFQQWTIIHNKIIVFNPWKKKNIRIPLRQSQTSHPKQAFSSKRPCLNPHFCSVTCQPCVTICYQELWWTQSSASTEPGVMTTSQKPPY